MYIKWHNRRWLHFNRDLGYALVRDSCSFLLFVTLFAVCHSRTKSRWLISLLRLPKQKRIMMLFFFYFCLTDDLEQNADMEICFSHDNRRSIQSPTLMQPVLSEVKWVHLIPTCIPDLPTTFLSVWTWPSATSSNSSWTAAEQTPARVSDG